MDAASGREVPSKGYLVLPTLLTGSRRSSRVLATVAAALTSAALVAGQASGAEPEAGLGAASHAAVPVGSQVVFEGDYETGDFSQWETCQSAVRNSDCA